MMNSENLLASLDLGVKLVMTGEELIMNITDMCINKSSNVDNLKENYTVEQLFHVCILCGTIKGSSLVFRPQAF